MPSWRSLILAPLILLATAASALAQQAAPHIGYAYPAGGKQGSTFTLTIGGQSIDTCTEALFTGPGISATILEATKPLTFQQVQAIREQLKQLQEKRIAASQPLVLSTAGTRPTTRPVWTAEDQKKVAELRKKLENPPNRQANPALAETVTLQVTIAPDSEPGDRELRLITPAGRTNPIAFRVGQLPEFTAEKIKGRVNQPEMTVTLPVVINGQILPGEVDRYRFKATKGQKLVAVVSARELIPYIADAVPGWFQATIALYDAKGREVAYDDSYKFNPDPVLYCVIPEDGEYAIEIRDSIFRGREDFIYRIALGELPFITSIFPLGTRSGSPTPLQLTGWNLPTTRMTQPADAPGLAHVSLTSGTQLSNSVPFAVDSLPEYLEHEPNDTIEQAQAVSLPIIINGRIAKPGDVDVFKFDAQTGQTLILDVNARRLGSPLDSILRITDAAGKQLAVNDDAPDKGEALLTHLADSYLIFKAPATGTYFVHLSDNERHGGADFAYRLRISEPRPDFQLRVTPSTLIVKGNATVPLTAYAIRKDGFDGPITLSLIDAPGYTLGGATIPAGQNEAKLTLTIPNLRPRDPLPPPTTLRLQGQATLQGHPATRPAIPAEDMTQAFSYHHLVPTQDLQLCVTSRWMARTAITLVSPAPVKIPVGGAVRLTLALPPRIAADEVQLELADAPPGLSIKSIAPDHDAVQVTLQSDKTATKGNTQGSLILNAFMDRAAQATTSASKPAGPKRRVPIGTLPAIPYTVLSAPAPTSQK